MKQAYIKKSFTRATREIIRQAVAIVEEYEEQGLQITLRQLYYQFVSRDLIANKQSEYKRLGKIVSDARLAGFIDWDSIVDLTREIKELSHWSDPGDIITAAARSFRMDKWAGQKYRPEVWIEKEALVSVIRPICEALDVGYFACKGYVSQSSMREGAERLCRANQTPVIIHLGDHDPSGIDMTRDIADRQDLFGSLCHLERIALNMDQVEKYGPPPNPAKMTDSRIGGYMSLYGDESWELDALEPSLLQSLIEDKVLEYRDEDILKKVEKEETGHKALLWHVAENWETI